MHVLIVAPESRKHGDVVELTSSGTLHDTDSPNPDNTLFIKQVRAGGHRFYVADSSTIDKTTVDRFSALLEAVGLEELMKCEVR